jgi:hypothetical protein
VNDVHPLYYAPWYPRYTQVFFNFYSNVDGLGIPFSNLHVELNSIPLTVTDPVIPYVLYHLYAADYRGRLLFDQVLNLNDTGIYVDIGLDIAVQIFIHFYSSIDHLGLPFDTVKLYIDGVRYTRFDPIMDMMVIHVVVRDFADIVLYTSTINLSVTGVYLDISLNIATITFTNNYDESVVFEMTRGNTTVTIALGRASNVQLRLAMGNYSYIVTNTNGTLLESRDITFAAASPEDFVINIGPVQNGLNPTATIIIYSFMFGVSFGGIAVLGQLFKYSKRKNVRTIRRDH